MNVVLTIFGRELRLALRSGGGASLGLAFFFIVVLLMPFGIGPIPETLQKIAPGTLWVAALLACLLSLDRLFQTDFEDGTLDILLLSPMPLEGLIAIKAASHWMTTGLPLLIVAPVLGITLNLADSAYIWLIISLAVGTPALSFLGAVGAALTVGIKRGGLLLSLLVLPLYIPTLIFGARCVGSASENLDPTSAFILLTGVTLFTLAMSPIAAAAALRMHMR